MSTSRFYQWLDEKMEKCGKGKLIPPEAVLENELREKVLEKLAREIRHRILEENGAQGQIERAYEKIKLVVEEKSKDLTSDVAEALDEEPVQSWRDPILKLADILFDVEAIRS